MVFPQRNSLFSKFRWSKLEVKIDEKSIKKWSQDGKASWHRFLMDFGGFLEASWEGKWSQDRSQEASKKRWKNGRHQDGHKMRKGRSTVRSKGPRRVRTSDSHLVAILAPSIFHRFFDASWDRSWLHVPSQLASKNPPKSIKIDAKMPSHLDSIF